MATNPKLEFYRFALNPRNESFKTFRDFAIDELKAKKACTDEEAFTAIFKHFIKSMEADFATDKNLKKKLAIINRSSVNKHHDKKPTLDTSQFTIQGVINGGPFGRDRIVSDIVDLEDSSSLGFNKSVLLYFYVLAYFPPDHNEGFFMIHSNGSDESITILFRKYISNLFKGKNYNKAIPEPFCPQSFQDEFREGALLQNLTFKTTIVDTIPSADPITQLLRNYDIKIEATPKNKDVSVGSAQKFYEMLRSRIFGTRDRNKKLADFTTKMTAKNEITKAVKVFDWNTRDQNFIPVVYLDGKITSFNPDGTPDFEELNDLCQNLFNDEILGEIRPDLGITRG